MIARTTGLRATVVFVLTSLLLTGCSSAGGTGDASDAERETLTLSTAARVYLGAVCPVNDAWDRADVQLELLRLADARGEPVDDRSSALQAAMHAVAEESERAAARLADEEYVWPGATAEPIGAVEESLRADAEEARLVADRSASEALEHEWSGAAEAAASAEQARLALELPEESGSGCDEPQPEEEP